MSLSLVSIYEAEAPEWNTTALGPSKRQAAEELLQRLWMRQHPLAASLPLEPWADVLGVLSREHVALVPPYFFTLR